MKYLLQVTLLCLIVSTNADENDSRRQNAAPASTGDQHSNQAFQPTTVSGRRFFPARTQQLWREMITRFARATAARCCRSQHYDDVEISSATESDSESDSDSDEDLIIAVRTVDTGDDNCPICMDDVFAKWNRVEEAERDDVEFVLGEGGQGRVSTNTEDGHVLTSTDGQYLDDASVTTRCCGKAYHRKCIRQVAIPGHRCPTCRTKFIRDDITTFGGMQPTPPPRRARRHRGRHRPRWQRCCGQRCCCGESCCLYCLLTLFYILLVILGLGTGLILLGSALHMFALIFNL